jgi:hypothetical protein
MHSVTRTLFFSAVAALSIAKVSAESPDPLIGTWNANMGKSTFYRSTPKSVKRTFDYTRDGLILVTRETIDQNGKVGFLHWYLALDGKEYGEYQRNAGAEPVFWLSGKVVDSHTKQIHDRQAVEKNPTIIDYTYVVSPDGKTLTITANYNDEKGQPQSRVEVYDKMF